MLKRRKSKVENDKIKIKTGCSNGKFTQRRNNVKYSLSREQPPLSRRSFSISKTHLHSARIICAWKHPVSEDRHPSVASLEPALLFGATSLILCKMKTQGPSWMGSHLHLAVGNLGVQTPRGMASASFLCHFTMNEMLTEPASRGRLRPPRLLCVVLSSSLTLELVHVSWICRWKHLVFLRIHPYTRARMRDSARICDHLTHSVGAGSLPLPPPCPSFPRKGIPT